MTSFFIACASNTCTDPELRTCVKVDVTVLGSWSLINLTVSVEVKYHERRCTDPRWLSALNSFFLFLFFQHEMDSNNKRTDLQWTPIQPATDGICIHFNFCLSKNAGNTRAVFLKLHCANLEAWSERPLIAVKSQQRDLISASSIPTNTLTASLCVPPEEREAGTVFVFLFCTIIKISLYNTLKKMYISYLAKSCWWSLCSLWVELEVQGRAIHRYLTPLPPSNTIKAPLSLCSPWRERGWYCICIFVLYNHQDFIVQYIKQNCMYLILLMASLFFMGWSAGTSYS